MTMTLSNPIKRAAILAATWPAYGPYPAAPDPGLPINPAFTVMASPPTVTVSAAAGASIIVGAVPYDKLDPVFTFWGARPITGPSDPDDKYVSPDYTVTAGTLYVSAVWGVEFETDAAEFELRMQGRGSTHRYRLTVDGDGYEAQQGRTGPASNGSDYLAHYNLGTAAWRRIRFTFGVGHRFAGVLIPSTASIQASSRDLGPKVIIIGDSFVEGTGAVPISSYGDRLSEITGLYDITMSGVGGTGVINTNSGTKQNYGQRFTKDVIDQDAEVVVILLSGNDSASYVDATYRTALGTLLDTAIAAFPDSPIFIDGPWWDSGSPTSTMMLMWQAALDLTAARDLPWIDQYGGPRPYSGNTADYVNTGWLTGTGQVGSPTGSGNSDLYVSSDGTHPSQAGHDYRGEKLADALAYQALDLYIPRPYVAPVPPVPIVPDTYAEVILNTDGLITYWPLNDASPSATAEVAFGVKKNFGTITSMGAYQSTSLLTGDTDTCMTFNGTTSVIRANGYQWSASLYSMEGWWNSTRAVGSAGSLGYPFSRGSVPNLDAIKIRGTAGSTQGILSFYNGADNELAGVITAANTTYHLVLTRNGNTVKVYLNGALVYTGSHASVVGTSTRIVLGGDNNGGSTFQGKIDEPAIYNVELDAATVLAHYNAGLGVFS